jgi:hypothetical protein
MWIYNQVIFWEQESGKVKLIMRGQTVNVFRIFFLGILRYFWHLRNLKVQHRVHKMHKATFRKMLVKNNEGLPNPLTRPFHKFRDTPYRTSGTVWSV